MDPQKSLYEEFDHIDSIPVPDRPAKNPLISAIKRVLGRVDDFKAKVKDFYFEVVLSPYRCPQCDGRLKMTAP